MKWLLVLSLLVWANQPTRATEESCSLGTHSTSYPVGDMRNCELSTNDGPAYRMEVLPGGGFDNLRNLDMGLVHAYNYSQCQMSPDGKYLLPDNVFLIPLQQSKLDLFSELFDHWDNYTDVTSGSINAGGSYGPIGGKFSAGYSSTKTHQFNDRSVSTRTQIRHKLYTAKVQPGAQLNSKFKASIIEIATNLQNNNTELANYLAELLIRDYGTHYVTSVDAGAVLAKTDHLDTSYTEDKTKKTIKASASASFFGAVSIGSKFSHTSTTDSGYNTSLSHSEISSYGGPPYQPVNFSLADWEKGVPNTLVAIDRAGDPLYYAINSNTLPEWPDITVQEVAETVDKAISRYYKVNSRYGCTNRNAANVNFQANIDDNSCKMPTTSFSFGGVFQTCGDINDESNTICSQVQQKNPLTSDYSCSSPYKSVLLHEGVVTKTVTERVCHKSWWKKKCQNVKMARQAKYSTYWCAALPGTKVPENTGYLFGGFYTSKENNPLTQTRGCPKYYTPLRMLEEVTVCVSDSYETARDSSLNFAGFESCKAGNPLATNANTTTNNWPHDCPPHYTPQLVTVDGDCEVNFCVHHGAFGTTSLLPIKLPPFRKHAKLVTNMTHTLSLVTLDGDVWMRNDSGQWYVRQSGPDSGETLLIQLGLIPPEVQPAQGLTTDDQSPQSLSNGVVATLSVVSTLALGALVLGAMFVGRRIRHSRKKKSEYSELNNSGSHQQHNVTDERV
ncbi:macrophage-expressed gene 1 protein-like [Halichondria panicea]|uniref:macrophage-expressed gene 1 protein-like n=1 Tax=Halichondria panicea TaxID=6063 RepID=UPI00312B6641